MAGLRKFDPSLLLTFLFFVFFMLALLSSYYKYYYTKNYDYLVEAKCDSQTETCSFRDCQINPDNCPPNGFSYFKSYYVKAYDFPKCSDNSCEKECTEKIIDCRLVPINAN